MQLTHQDSPIIGKTRELCQAIVAHPEFEAIRQHISNFLSDEPSQQQYQTLSDKGGILQNKQREGQDLTEAEINDYEQHREAFLRNTVARNFLDAQEAMRDVQNAVTKYVAKTFELGRLPEHAELECGSCESHGCGCH